MGIFDHRRTWDFQLRATPDACANAFATALGSRTGMIMGSKWNVSVSKTDGKLPSGTATYAGRGGLIGGVSQLSQTAMSENSAALGSQMSFAVTRHETKSGTSACSIQMTRTGSILIFFTADARFFRAAMNRVASELRKLDPGLAVTKA